ncbi:hypothetical protein [Shewanella donghaensis]|uniref:hypothetical protein n=1 Tax=Shewanella donghaensis TaxID=238836 RepID=UPI001183EF85|nr:hypothetical protein [Shewanella donghaensis]
MNNFIKKTAIASLATIGILSVASTALAGYQNKWILEYHYMSGSSVVGEKIVNQCTGSSTNIGQVTTSIRLVASEPCGYDF